MTFKEKKLAEFEEKYNFKTQFEGEHLAGLNMLKKDIKDFLSESIEEALQSQTQDIIKKVEEKKEEKEGE